MTDQDFTHFMTSSSSGNGGDAHALIAKLRFSSQQFQESLNRQDYYYAIHHSKEAWLTIVGLFDYFRNGQDYGRISKSKMDTLVSPIARKIKSTDRDIMIRNRNVDRGNTNFGQASLRETLNKSAHFDKENASYKIENGDHVLILSGPEQNPNNGFWVIEVTVSELCKACEEALK